jgi:integrase
VSKEFYGEDRDEWWIRFRGADGKVHREPTGVRTKTEARRVAFERQKAENALRVAAASHGPTVQELVVWWLDEFRNGTASEESDRSVVTKHLVSAPVGALRLGELTTPVVSNFLRAKERDDGLSPRSVNALRMFLVMAINRALEAGHWTGANVAEQVKPRRLEQKARDTLRPDDVLAVIRATPPERQNVIAFLIYTGARKGEALGLRREDVDLEGGVIILRRSHGRDSTKGKRDRLMPITPELGPYLVRALESTESEWVFPGQDGQRMRKDMKLERVLRNALAAAGLVTGYEHRCYKRRCQHVERVRDAEPRRCPFHGTLLGATGIPRSIRLHDLRGTFATLLIRSGASTGAVQRLLGHADPRTTMNAYVHATVDDLRQVVDRLRFEPQEQERSAPNCAPTLPERVTSDTATQAILARTQRDSVRARRESNPRPSDSKSDALSD